MLRWLFVLSCGCFVNPIDGLTYEDSNFTILESAPAGTRDIFVGAAVREIKGKETELNSFTYWCRDSLNFVEFDGSSLKVIGSYSFAKLTNIKKVNLSKCVVLESIGARAFMSSKIEEIVFPKDGVLKNLKASAFNGCNLAYVLIVKSIESIQNSCFANNKNLTIVEFENDSNCTTFDNYAFENTMIASFKVPKKAKTLSAAIFSYCQKLMEITVEFGSNYFSSIDGILYDKNKEILICFPRGLEIEFTVQDGTKSIANEAFRSCLVKKLFLPSTIETIGSYSFADTPNLDEVLISNSLYSFGSGSFRSCQISSFSMPLNASVVSAYLLQSCTKLSSVQLHSNVTQIQNNAFIYCTSLTSIVITEGVKSILSYAFQGCTSLQDVLLPQGIETIEGGVFENCHPNLVVRFSEKGNYDVDEQYIIYKNNMTNVIQMFANPQNLDIVLPDSVVNISKGAFANRPIKSIKFGGNLSHIESRAFASCSKLNYINITSSSISYDSAVFSSSSIQSINLGTPEILPKQLFLYCRSLKSVTIPSSVLEIQAECFFGNSMLESVIFEHDSNLTKIYDNVFTSCPMLRCIQIPKKVMHLGQSIFGGKSIQEASFEAGSSIDSIGIGAFMDSDRLENISFPDSPVSLSEMSFARCRSLVHLVIGRNVRLIDDYCFSGCSNLKTIEIEEGSILTDVSGSALEGLESLSEVHVPKSNPAFECSADFSVWYSKNCKKIVKYCCRNPRTSFSIPSTVESIGSCAFENAVLLANVKIPSSIEVIDARAFAGCTGLTSIIIPNSVKLVGSMTFHNCTSLKCGSVKYPSELRDSLISSGIPIESLNKCITKIFTINSDFKPRKASALSCVFLYDE